LVRWVDPERGMIPPGEFIPFAEETGLIAALDAWVLRNACVQVREWGARFGRDDLSISVNLSGKQFEQPGLVASVAAALENSGLPPRCLRLEITEGVVMDDAQSSAQTLAELKALGCSLAIDDFGTGYPSLAYLHQFPLDVLKIDRSFVMRLAADGTTRRSWAPSSTSPTPSASGRRRRRRRTAPGCSAARYGMRVRPGLPVLAPHRRRIGREAAGHRRLCSTPGQA
jgi:EAL domain-containing protein (putative c-di-GMP-specific phosphodiesterase class I)